MLFSTLPLTALARDPDLKNAKISQMLSEKQAKVLIIKNQCSHGMIQRLKGFARDFRYGGGLVVNGALETLPGTGFISTIGQAAVNPSALKERGKIIAPPGKDEASGDMLIGNLFGGGLNGLVNLVFVPAYLLDGDKGGKDSRSSLDGAILRASYSNTMLTYQHWEREVRKENETCQRALSRIESIDTEIYIRTKASERRQRERQLTGTVRTSDQHLASIPSTAPGKNTHRSPSNQGE